MVSVYIYICILTVSAPQNVGRPGKLKKRMSGSVTSGQYVEDWHRCVKQLTVSSKESTAMKLIDGTDGYWQSSGSQGKVNGKAGMCLHLFKFRFNGL